MSSEYHRTSRGVSSQSNSRRMSQSQVKVTDRNWSPTQREVISSLFTQISKRVESCEYPLRPPSIHHSPYIYIYRYEKSPASSSAHSNNRGEIRTKHDWRKWKGSLNEYLNRNFPVNFHNYQNEKPQTKVNEVKFTTPDITCGEDRSIDQFTRKKAEHTS